MIKPIEYNPLSWWDPIRKIGMKVLSIEKNTKRVLINIEEQRSWFVRLFVAAPKTYQVFAPLNYDRWSWLDLCYLSGKNVDVYRASRIRNLVDIHES